MFAKQLCEQMNQPTSQQPSSPLSSLAFLGATAEQDSASQHTSEFRATLPFSQMWKPQLRPVVPACLLGEAEADGGFEPRQVQVQSLPPRAPRMVLHCVFVAVDEQTNESIRDPAAEMPFSKDAPQGGGSSAISGRDSLRRPWAPVCKGGGKGHKPQVEAFQGIPYYTVFSEERTSQE